MIEWRNDELGFLNYFPGAMIWATCQDNSSVKMLHHYYGTWDEERLELLRENRDDQRGVFFTVNELVKAGISGFRKKEMWVRSRAIFIDDDLPRGVGDFRDDFKLTPTLVVETSPGKFHYYWITSCGNGTGYADDRASADEWQAVERSLVSQYGGDPNVKDLSRIMRMPGSRHMKGGPEWDEAWIVRWCVVGEKYEWSELLDTFKTIESERKHTNSDSHFTNDERINQITNGEGYHENLLNLAWQMKKDGLSDNLIVISLQSFMNNCSDELKEQLRWQERYKDIARIVQGAQSQHSDIDWEGLNKECDKLLHERGEFNLAGVDDKDAHKLGIPWPPAGLGGLAMNAYDMQRYQYKQIALVSALALVGGISGRKFNISGTGLNEYYALMMSTGMGKDQISNFIAGAVLNQLGDYRSFLGPSRFTGAKAIYNLLKSQRSCVCVMGELGISKQEKSGAPLAVLRALLQAYTKSGKTQYLGHEGYSKEDESLPIIQSPSITIIGESTETALQEALRNDDSIERGELARHIVLRIGTKRPYQNMEVKDLIDQDHLDRLGRICQKCADIQATEDPAVWELIPFDDRMMKEWEDRSNYYTDVYNDCIGRNEARASMASRMFVHEIKAAGIATVYNYEEQLQVGWPEWEWAKAYGDYVFRGVDGFLAGSVFGDPVQDTINNVVIPAIVNMFLPYPQCGKTIHRNISTKEKKAGQFPYRALYQRVMRHKDIKALGDDARQRSDPKSGLQKCLSRMITMGYIECTKADYMQSNQSNAVYKVMPEFASAVAAAKFADSE